jgi:hypothetical protein
VSGEYLIPVLGQQISARVLAGTGVPLVLCNGIGASLEVLDPPVAQLNPDTTVMRFDVPGAFGSRKYSPARAGLLRTGLPVSATRRRPQQGEGGILSPVVGISPPIRLTGTAAAKRVVVQIRLGLTQSATPTR